MTRLVATIAASTPAQAEADVAAAVRAGCDLIELRLDYLADADGVAILRLFQVVPETVEIILTIRSREEGGAWDGDDDERVARMIEWGSLADHLDVEFATWSRSANIRLKIDLARRESGGDSHGTRLILSSHDLRGRPAKLNALLADMLAVTQADAFKLVWTARTVRDNFEAFDLLREAPRPLTVFCMGAAGRLSRILGRKFGAFATYAAVNEERAAAPGQLTVEQLKTLYRWDAIGPDTAVYGLLGCPVEHSLGPAVHNAAFTDARIDAVYVPLPVEPSYEAFKAFVVEVLARPWLGMAGFSVTVPHKENALRLVREMSGQIDPLCERIGAANTLCLGDDGSLRAANTDAEAARASIRRLLGRPGVDLASLRCAVLGAGGVARAVVAVLSDARADVQILNRTRSRAETLARDFGCRVADWNDRGGLQADLIVNCTPVGMSPADAESPMPTEAMRSRPCVFDTVYSPLRTRLLREAAALGCRTMDGLAMFVDQACRQFEIWTGRPAPAERMRAWAESVLPQR